MSSRLHSKYHRHNHHTRAIRDPRYPDASHDPIASHESPFLGDFVMSGTLSAVPLSGDQDAIKAEGNIHAKSLTTSGSITATNIFITGDVLQTFNEPVTATGDFLIVNIEGRKRGVRLWDGDEIAEYIPPQVIPPVPEGFLEGN